MRSSSALAAHRGTHVHALHLGEISKQRNTSAPHRAAITVRDEELDVGLEDRIERQPVPLLGRVLGT